MSAASVTATAARPRVAALPVRAQVLMLVVGVFVLALAPRLVALGLFPTSDEDSWMRRTGGFTFGLVNNQLGRTYQNGHPGVTTMWIGMLAQGTDGALRFADRVHGLRFVGQAPGYLDGLAQARVGFALLGALGAAASAWLVWRLFGPGTAVLAGAALAAEPFLVANQQLVHVDGPLVTFTVLAGLATVVRFAAGGGAGLLLLAGVATGLALLSKTPALFLVPYVPLVAVGSAALGILGAWRSSPPVAMEARAVRIAALPVLRDLLIWAALAALTFYALWPALWVLGPGEVFTRIVAFTRETGGQPDEVGSFFLGQVGADPGPLYYPVSTLFRLSPFATLGLVLAAVLARRAPRETLQRAGWLLVFAGGFGLMMTLGPKKFDRYLLPAVPMLVILASLGWWLLLERLARPAARIGLGVALGLVLVFPLASVYPYALAYYNPLLGGGPAAQRAVMIGNGEGLDQAAAWLAAQPNAADLRVSAHSWDILAGLVPADGEPLREGVPNDADYIVTYGRRIQMHRWGASLERYLAANPPVYVVRINGIEYVHIHPGPKRGAQP
ncbi:MAG: glycosyltransferase family 39 protein [Chloroflexi bacterium]|nr:glycosyltransferase family 39 protein [Chloroflexota bacterium]